MDEFTYFIIRIKRIAGKGSESSADPLAGVIERLGSGEKRVFDGAEEMVRLVSQWNASAAPLAKTKP